MLAIKKIVILGGGTSGWFSAAVLAHQFKKSSISIELVESDQIGIIGVGEATIPPFIDALQSIDIDPIDFIRETQSTFKLGIKFTDWKTLDHDYLHPFGQIGQDFNHQNFYQSWLKLSQQGSQLPLMAFSPSAVMCDNNKFAFPNQMPQTPIQASAFALHLDARLAAKYFRKYAENLGVKRTEGLVEDVALDDSGFVNHLTLQDNSKISGDFFFDCSGFRAVILGDALGVEFEDWSEYLTVNKAVTVQTSEEEDFPTFTESKAQKYGWSWRIPLQHRTGNGYVFDSQYCSVEEAKQTLLDTVKGVPLTEPQLVHFKTGMMQQSWKKNCIGIGLASGFLEPLESTAIHMITRGIKQFVRMIPKQHDEILVDEYNRRMRRDFEEIRDFLVMHYCLTQRQDTEFWKYYREMLLPKGLRHKLELFSSRGLLVTGEEDLFANDNWYSVLEGMGIRAKNYDPLLDEIEFEEIAAKIKQIPDSILKAIQSIPGHKEFIDKFCPSKNVD